MQKFHRLLLLSFLLPWKIYSGECNECTTDQANEIQSPSNIIHPKTFFNPRQVTFDATFELALTNYDVYHPLDCDSECYYGLHLYATPFYEQSRKSCALARYFLPNGKCAINVREDGTGDVDPLWLGLAGVPGTPYSSIFGLKPQRKAGGVVLNARVDLGDWADCLCNYWLWINTAVVRAKHNLNVCEVPATQDTCVAGANMCTALNSPTLTAGKISCESLTRTGLDDIQVKLGYDWYYCGCDQDSHIAPYLIAGIPTGKRPKSEYLFEPLVGSKHGSFGGGLNADANIWAHNNASIVWMMDFKYRYIFKARERRSIDLCSNLDWSRYLLLANISDPITPIPAINILTTDVHVTPRSEVNFWTALHYERCDWGFELGYNLWWRQREKVSLDGVPAIADLGIFDLAGAAVLNPTSASTATISQSVGGTNPVVSDPTFVTLTIADLNLESAQHPRAVSHKVYAGGDYRCCWCQNEILVGVVGSYEFAGTKRNALQQWAIFGKLGISF